MAILGSVTFRQRHLMKQATMTVTISNPAHDRLLCWVGMQCVKAGMRLMGIGRVEVAFNGGSALTEDRIREMVEDEIR